MVIVISPEMFVEGSIVPTHFPPPFYHDGHYMRLQRVPTYIGRRISPLLLLELCLVVKSTMWTADRLCISVWLVEAFMRGLVG